MTGRIHRLLAFATLFALGMGCGSTSSGNNNPLVGTWAYAFTEGTLTVTDDISVNSDGTLSAHVSGMSADCTGSWTTTGFTWSSTGNEVSFAGTSTCAGSVTCGPLTLSCTAATNRGWRAGSCNYALSNGNNTLTLSNCTGPQDATLIRTP